MMAGSYRRNLHGVAVRCANVSDWVYDRRACDQACGLYTVPQLDAVPSKCLLEQLLNKSITLAATSVAT
jgi:hypothetical protein